MQWLYIFYYYLKTLEKKKDWSLRKQISESAYEEFSLNIKTLDTESS